MTDMNYIYTMNMHETVRLNVSDDDVHRIVITRVPGGWTYTHISADDSNGANMSSCFVPYNDKN